MQIEKEEYYETQEDGNWTQTLFLDDNLSYISQMNVIYAQNLYRSTLNLSSF